MDKLARFFLITTFDSSKKHGSIDHDDVGERMLSESSDYDFEYETSLPAFPSFAISRTTPALTPGLYFSHVFEFYQPPQRTLV